MARPGERRRRTGGDLFATAALLGGLFTMAIILGGIAAVIVPACREAVIGG